MAKKNDENFNCNEKSIYCYLKEFYDNDSDTLYSYEGYENAGVQEFKIITGKIRSLPDYKKNILANQLVEIFMRNIKNDDKLSEVNNFLEVNPIIGYYENLLSFFKASMEVNKKVSPKIKDLIIKMITQSNSSEVVKFGLLLAPICNNENIEDVLKVFSIHNDYLFYVIKAYEYMGDCNDTIFSISKKSKGYGKVFSVMNLRPTTSKIKKWMIEEGSINNVGVPELLSYSMLSLDLLDYLEETKVTNENIEILSKSFSRLFSDYGLDDIKDGIKVCDKLLEIINKTNGGIYSLYTVISILYLIESIIIDDYKEKRSPRSVEFNNKCKEIIENCKKIYEKDIWHEIVSKEVSNVDIESSVIISCAEKTKYKLKKKEFESLIKRDFNNALLYKYAFSVGNKSIKKCAFDYGMKNLQINAVLNGQDELKIENLSYNDIAQICFFIIIKYAQYEDFQDKYKETNLQALKAPLIETRIQAISNLQRFREEFDYFDKEIINDAISTEMVRNIRRSLRSLLIKTNDKEKNYIEIDDSMHIDEHVKDIYLINVDVAGTSYIDMSEVSNKLSEGDMLYLKREQNNEYDLNAIAIITTEGYVIGYVPKESNLILKNLMDKGKYLYGTIKEISDDFNHINIKIYLSYKDIIEEITNTLSLLSREREYYIQ